MPLVLEALTHRLLPSAVQSIALTEDQSFKAIRRSLPSFNVKHTDDRLHDYVELV